MGGYSFSKKDIIQDKIVLKQSNEQAKNSTEKKHKKINIEIDEIITPERIEKAKEISTHIIRFILLNLPSFLVFSLILYTLLQIGLCITDYWMPKWYPDKYAADWVKPFINILPHAFHKNAYPLGQIVLTGIVGWAAIMGARHNIEKRVEESFDENWSSLGVYLLKTAIPSIICGLFIYTACTPSWFDNLTLCIEAITAIVIALGALILFGLISGNSNSSGGESSSNNSNNPEVEELKIVRAIQNNNNLFSVHYEVWINGKRHSEGGWSGSGKILYRSASSITIEYDGWVRTYNPKGVQEDAYHL